MSALEAMGTLHGSLTPVGGLSGVISDIVTSLSGTLSLDVGAVPSYTGDYEITPSFEEQTLYTSGKKMSDDVTVHEIPIVRTSNPQGGWTVLIG